MKIIEVFEPRCSWTERVTSYWKQLNIKKLTYFGHFMTSPKFCRLKTIKEGKIEVVNSYPDCRTLETQQEYIYGKDIPRRQKLGTRSCSKLGSSWCQNQTCHKKKYTIQFLNFNQNLLHNKKGEDFKYTILDVEDFFWPYSHLSIARIYLG